MMKKLNQTGLIATIVPLIIFIMIMQVTLEIIIWEEYGGNFDRTFSKISNMMTCMKMGYHDYCKFIKSGYGSYHFGAL